jgi:N-carbamoyl-L-amino-acid hydrolase
VTVAAFSNEEGVRFQPDMLGSLVTAGGMELEEALEIIGTDGTRLGDELARIGYAGSLRPGSLRPAAYLELHIEQGPLLAEADVQIGAVENLQGISWQQIIIDGTANHAGTTPTRLRHDAGYAAGALIAEVRRIAVASGTTLATVGSIRFEPDVINVIPRRAVLTLDLRDPDEQRLQAAERAVADFLAEIAAQEGLTVTATRLARFEPVIFDAGLVAQIEAAAQQRGFSVRRMTSGAGHDAQMIARIAPSAMIFIPSRDGISHNPAEYSSDEQILAGAQVLADTVAGWLAANP